MKGLETGKDKIQKICDTLRKETLEPAKQEAREIVENARIRSEEILRDAQVKAEEIFREAAQGIEERQRLFQSSLQLACKQGIEQLKQRIEEQLFDRELAHVVSHEMGDPKVIATILNSFMRIMEEKGIDDDFMAVIPKSIPPRSISALLAARVIERLKEKAITVGDFSGGVQIQLKGRQITIDISDSVVRELIALYIRRDFRDLVFNV
ncbi:MAG: V-type ATP synthase subunit E [Chlamydiia bacterium]|nr:V-type ATP synthase subunit E [Chlamydiia bacterium]